MLESQKRAIKKYAQSEKGRTKATKYRNEKKLTHKFLGFWVPIAYVDVVKKCVSQLIDKDY